MFQYNTIEEALEDLRQGKMILCTDDPDRENEGDEPVLRSELPKDRKGTDEPR